MSKGCAFLMDMGTGKTITTIAVAGTMFRLHKITKMLVVAPKSIVDVWQQEFDKFADFPYSVAVLDGDSAKKADTIRYARVSMEKEEQEDSFERQVEYYTGYIQRNADWEFVEVYADPGITGTRAEKRPNFMRMIADCRAGKIDKILVKSISRFARNTVDALNYIRELREIGVGVFFENENIDTHTGW